MTFITTLLVALATLAIFTVFSVGVLALQGWLDRKMIESVRAWSERLLEEDARKREQVGDSSQHPVLDR